ncbi:response regulator [Eubacterium sp. MSJ-13]|uniref:HD-GYP domain-containing protein n=1 Tax=Eubacterium sp. MSJ-13 TaxID=2841513 RepID=UPI001C101CD0|nr:HD domain-containing phosphohydrolase [Eubacterium sp. MSJ-13]MBU5478477.1 response regulator [Eubacterium sp. MSJ-13]
MAVSMQVNEQPNILIVDDVSTNLVILSEMVKSTGCIPRPVTSVKQAQTAIDRKIPQLILLDISMPETDGFEFCAMLKADVKTRDIPIIFISALDSVEDKIKGFKLGAVDYIAKPFEKEEVTLRLNTHLKIYKLQQEMEAYNRKLHQVVNEQITRGAEEQKNELSALADILDIQSNVYEKGIDKVSINCRMLAISLQFSPKFDKVIPSTFVDEIEAASQLYDIGMLSVSDDIAYKKTALTDEEWDKIKSHTIIGADYLKKINKDKNKNSYLEMAADIAKYHHENWDGTGYPEGISGEDIPLSARIVAVIDTYMALNSERSYRNAYTKEESLSIMRSEAGKRFDPSIIDIFCKIQKQLQ